LTKGYNQFIINFDYPSLYPGKASRKDYIITVINKVLRLQKQEFEVKDYTSQFKISPQKASNEIKIIREYALIIEIDNLGAATKRYSVIEPRLRYLIQQGITKVRNEANEEQELDLELAETV
jgi:hypothetical protein